MLLANSISREGTLRTIYEMQHKPGDHLS